MKNSNENNNSKLLREGVVPQSEENRKILEERNDKILGYEKDLDDMTKGLEEPIQLTDFINKDPETDLAKTLSTNVNKPIIRTTQEPEAQSLGSSRDFIAMVSLQDDEPSQSAKKSEEKFLSNSEPASEPDFLGLKSAAAAISDRFLNSCKTNFEYTQNSNFCEPIEEKKPSLIAHIRPELDDVFSIGSARGSDRNLSHRSNESVRILNEKINSSRNSNSK